MIEFNLLNSMIYCSIEFYIYYIFFDLYHIFKEEITFLFKYD